MAKNNRPLRSFTMATALSATRNRKRRHGVALVWLALSMVALVGLVALGIDMGRIQLTRTELQTTADASARAAVWPVPALQFADGQARAQALMDANDAGGAAIGFDVDQDDLQFGIWWRNTGTFEPLYGEDRVHANAVLVRDWRHTDRGNPLPMGFATALGFDQADIGAAAVALIRGGSRSSGHGWGIFGIDYIRSNGTTLTDSYDPTVAAYNAATAGDGGGIATNGYLEVIGTSDINGDARWGPDGNISPDTDYLDVWPNATVTGWRAPLDEDILFPPAQIPASYNNQPLISAGLIGGGKGGGGKGGGKGGGSGGSGGGGGGSGGSTDINLSGNSTNTMPGGTAGNPNVYVVNNFTMRGNATLTIDGPVEIYVTGDLDLSGGTVTNDGDGAAWPLPSNLKIFMVGNGTVNLGGGSALHAQIYAPQSEVVIHGTGGSFGLFGAVVGLSIDIKGNSAIHYDGSKFVGQPEPDDFWVELVH